MYYDTIHDYLIDQFKKPIEKAIKKGDKKEVSEIIDYFIFKYEESNALAKGFEDYAAEKGVKLDIPIFDFITKYADKYLKKINGDDEN